MNIVYIYRKSLATNMFKIIFNTLLGIVLIFIWSRFVNLEEIFHTISKANFYFLVPIFICMFLSPFIRALRLKVFLSEIKNIPLKDLTFLNGAAILLNFLIPIRAGEVLKGVYLNNKYGLNIGKAVIWIFLDRFVDLLLVLALVPVFLFVVPTSLSINFIVVITTILIFSLILTYLAIFQVNFAKVLINLVRHIFIVSSIKIYFERFSHFILAAFSILRRHPKDLRVMVILTILAYMADAGVWYFTFLSLGVEAEYVKMYLGQLLSALTYLVPAAPGYVGSAEASGALILSGVFGMGVNLASSMIVLFHILTAIFTLIFGLISLFNLKIDLGLVFNKVFKQKPNQL